MDDTPEKVVPVLKKIHDAGKGVIGMKIIGQGHFRDNPFKREASVNYVTRAGHGQRDGRGLRKTGRN